MSILNEHVLVLNRSWVAVDACTVRAAFCKLFEEKAMFLDENLAMHGLESWLNLETKGQRALRSSRIQIRVPEILVLSKAVFPKRNTMQFSRRNLNRRDRMTCQYCGKHPGPQGLTIDHVIPKRNGGKSTWKNCVLSCNECNHKKADKSLAEAGMSLLPRPDMQVAYPHNPGRWTVPYVPLWTPVFKVSKNDVRESWADFVSEKALDALT
jgi:5-methylcytosine-specific restriction endonuclease McrA